MSTLVYVDVIKGIFMPETALQADIRLDSTDVALIELLERNGRMPFSSWPNTPDCRRAPCATGSII
ncbi:hypothetical protein ACETU7_19960 [Rhodococcus sp. 3Y1]